MWLIISIGDGIGGKTNENKRMDEDVDDVVACDQQPYEEKDKATNPWSRSWWVNSAIFCKRPTKLVTSRV